MLVLSRKRSERILIGSGIRITVVGIEGGRVKLGIEAPQEVTVLRNELRQRDTKAEAVATIGEAVAHLA